MGSWHFASYVESPAQTLTFQHSFMSFLCEAVQKSQCQIIWNGELQTLVFVDPLPSSTSVQLLSCQSAILGPYLSLRFATFIAAAFASLSNVRYVVHEKRDAEPSPQHRTSVEVDPSTIILLSIALTQRNLDKGHYFLIDMSNPLSSNHKKHWSAQKIYSNNFSRI